MFNTKLIILNANNHHSYSNIYHLNTIYLGRCSASTFDLDQFWTFSEKIYHAGTYHSLHVNRR